MSDFVESWSQEYGGGSITIGADNSAYLINSANYPSNSVYKFNENGSQAWLKTIHEGNYYYTDIISDTDDNIYLSGYVSYLDGRQWDSFISKVDNNGAIIWTSLIDNTGFDNSDYASALTISNDQHLYITGYSDGDLDGFLNQGENDIFISKFDIDGNKVWTEFLGSSENDISYDITTDLNGDIYLCGSTSGNLNEKTNAGGTDAFISKIDKQGNLQWTELIGTEEEDFFNSISTNQTGNNIFVSGSSHWEILYGKFDQSGETVWTNTTRLGFPNYTYNPNWLGTEHTSIAIAKDETIYIGTHNSDERGYSGVIVGEFDNQGSHVENIVHTNTGDDWFRGHTYLGDISTDNSGQDLYISSFQFSDYDKDFLKKFIKNDGSAFFSIIGTAEVGATLTLNQTETDLDGEEASEFTYSWQTSSDDSNWSVVGTAATYEVAGTDEGKSIRAVISYTDDRGFAEEVTTTADDIPYVDDGIAAFLISGPAEVGETLSISEDTADPDGTGDLTYSWQRPYSDNSNWFVVGTSSTYDVAAKDEGTSIRAVISYTDNQGFAEEVTITSDDIPYVDDGSAEFSIIGTSEVGETLSIIETGEDPDGRSQPLTVSWEASTDLSDPGSWIPLTEPSYSSSFSIENNLEAGRHVRASIIYEDDEGFSPLVKTSSVYIPYLIGPGEDLSGVDLADADLASEDLTSANLGAADLENADLSNAVLVAANLSGSDLSGADLTNADLSGADLTDADLEGADLTDADLSNVDLSNADLTYAYLTYADLSNVDLTNTDLTYADLNSADLTDADLTYADLTGVDLTYANLTGANLTDAANLTTAFKSTDGSRVYSIAGTASVGNTLSLTIDTQDPDGYNSNYDPSYSWQSSLDNVTWTEIDTSSTYTLTSADQGQNIQAEITYTDGEGFDQTVTTSEVTVPSYSFADEDLQTAVDLWLSDQATALATYGHISTWDVSQITDFSYLFDGASSFNDDISGWDVSNGTNFYSMFYNATLFNQDIGDWDVANGTDFAAMFDQATAFNQDIGDWDVGNGTNFEDMFEDATSFNQDIRNWDVSNGNDFEDMFDSATSFNQDIGNWDVSSGTDFAGMFLNATSFNQDIGNWDVSNGTDFTAMLEGLTSFNQDIGDWDVGNGTNFYAMFYQATSFNQDIGDWNVGNGTDFKGMFSQATSFNQDIGDWDVGNGTDFDWMFYGATSFNQDIGDWDVGNGTEFDWMFREASAFNQDIGNWDVSSGEDFKFMFTGTTSFDQDLSVWNVNSATDTTDYDSMFSDATAMIANQRVDITPNDSYFVGLTLDGTSASETIKGDRGNDVISGLEANDKLIGKGGSDKIYGEEGADQLKGQSGKDQLFGGVGDDRLKGGLGDDTLFGGDGDDTLTAGKGLDLLYGEAGDDVLKGNKGNDFLYGGEDDDKLLGGKGDDLLYGGDGDDLLYGGAGNDIFQINTDSGFDRIKDFESGDSIELLTGSGSVDLVQSGINVQVEYQGDLMAIVENITTNDLSQSGTFLTQSNEVVM